MSSLDVAPDLPALSLDFVLAEQALFNILDNAAKYSPPGGRIEVAARLADGRVEIVVRDEGPESIRRPRPAVRQILSAPTTGDRAAPAPGSALPSPRVSSSPGRHDRRAQSQRPQRRGIRGEFYPT
jgi:two-component system sensor histidine kinase KdpD